MRASFSPGDPEELSSLIAEGGFEALDLRAETRAVRFASVEHFVASYVAGSPLTAPVAAAPPGARDAPLAEVVAKLRQLVSGGELKFPIEAYLARVRSPGHRKSLSAPQVAPPARSLTLSRIPPPGAQSMSGNDIGPELAPVRRLGDVETRPPAPRERARQLDACRRRCVV
jgi:hypothetical protein